MGGPVKSYMVTATTSIVINDGAAALSYAPGAVFTARSGDPQIKRLLQQGKIALAAQGKVAPTTGYTVVVGPRGPQGPQGPVGPISDKYLEGDERLEYGQNALVDELRTEIEQGLYSLESAVTDDVLGSSLDTVRQEILYSLNAKLDELDRSIRIQRESLADQFQAALAVINARIDSAIDDNNALRAGLLDEIQGAHNYTNARIDVVEQQTRTNYESVIDEIYSAVGQSGPDMVVSDTQPELSIGRWAFWFNSDTSELYLCYNHAGTTFKVEMS